MYITTKCHSYHAMRHRSSHPPHLFLPINISPLDEGCNNPGDRVQQILGDDSEICCGSYEFGDGAFVSNNSASDAICESRYGQNQGHDDRQDNGDLGLDQGQDV
jgi:hypothetical protein